MTVDAEVEEYLAKLDKQLKAGLISILILSVIDRAGEPMYGYRIIQAILERTKGRISLQEGTVYPILRNLQNMGFLEFYLGESPEGAPRKYCRMTGAGKAALRGGAREWETLVEAAAAVMEKGGRRDG